MKWITEDRMCLAQEICMLTMNTASCKEKLQPRVKTVDRLKEKPAEKKP